MLHHLSEDIAECYLRAEQARYRAQQVDHAALKQESLDMERRWINLARSYEFLQSACLTFIKLRRSPSSAQMEKLSQG